MYELKKMERYLRVNLTGPDPRLMKNELPSRGLTKVEKHCVIVPLGFTPVQQGSISLSGLLRRLAHTWYGELPGIAPCMPKCFSWVERPEAEDVHLLHVASRWILEPRIRFSQMI